MPRTEANVLAGARRYLETRGWLVNRNNGGLWVPFSEHLSAKRQGRDVRPRTLCPDDTPDLVAMRPRKAADPAAGCDVIWLETKKPGEKPRRTKRKKASGRTVVSDQLKRLEDLRAMGFYAWWCDGVKQYGSERLDDFYTRHFPHG